MKEAIFTIQYILDGIYLNEYWRGELFYKNFKIIFESVLYTV